MSLAQCSCNHMVSICQAAEVLRGIDLYSLQYSSWGPRSLVLGVAAVMLSIVLLEELRSVCEMMQVTAFLPVLRGLGE